MARKTLYLMNDGGYMESIGIQKTALITFLVKILGHIQLQVAMQNLLEIV